MPDGARSLDFNDKHRPVDIETAISLIEAGTADDDLVVDMGNECLARADGRLGLKGLLQRLRGHRALTAMAFSDAADGVVTMHQDKPDVHPRVVAILDALKNHD